MASEAASFRPEDDDFSWVGDSVPCFATKGENVHILKEPKEFYDELLVGVVLFIYLIFLRLTGLLSCSCLVNLFFSFVSLIIN